MSNHFWVGIDICCCRDVERLLLVGKWFLLARFFLLDKFRRSVCLGRFFIFLFLEVEEEEEEDEAEGTSRMSDSAESDMVVG